HHERDMAELERGNAADRLVGREIAPLGQKLDRGALDVIEGEELRHTRDIVAANLALDASRGEEARDLGEAGARRELERQLGAARVLALPELKHERANFARQQRAVLLARRQHEPGDLGEVLDLLIEVRRLEGRVRYAPNLDHGSAVSLQH